MSHVQIHENLFRVKEVCLCLMLLSLLDNFELWRQQEASSTTVTKMIKGIHICVH